MSNVSWESAFQAMDSSLGRRVQEAALRVSELPEFPRFDNEEETPQDLVLRDHAHPVLSEFFSALMVMGALWRRTDDEYRLSLKFRKGDKAVYQTRVETDVLRVEAKNGSLYWKLLTGKQLIAEGCVFPIESTMEWARWGKGGPRGESQAQEAVMNLQPRLTRLCVRLLIDYWPKLKLKG